MLGRPTEPTGRPTLDRSRAMSTDRPKPLDTPHTRPAQALLTLRPVGSLDRPRRPLSRGFGPAGCPSGPLVSYQLNRQLAGWNLPPLVNRALRAHRDRGAAGTARPRRRLSIRW